MNSDLDGLIRRLELVLRDLRQFNTANQNVARSAGLTQFVVDLVESGKREAWTVKELLEAAKSAGFTAVTPRILGKRLHEHASRTGRIQFNREARGWSKL